MTSVFGMNSLEMTQTGLPLNTELKYMSTAPQISWCFSSWLTTYDSACILTSNRHLLPLRLQRDCTGRRRGTLSHASSVVDVSHEEIDDDQSIEWTSYYK